MKTWITVVLLVVVAAGAAAGGYFYGHRGATASAAGAPDKSDASDAATSQPAEDAPVAPVKTLPVRRGTISREVTAYGTVVAQAGEVQVVSMPFETRVGRLLATPGQQVGAGAPLLEISPSPDTEEQVIEARSAADAAKRDLAQIKERFDAHLATNADLFQAQQALQTAQLKLDSLVKRGAATDKQVLKADAAGVLSKVDVQEGQIVPAGGPLVEVARQNRIEVKLGVEPSDAARLRPDQPVSLSSVHNGSVTAVPGHVRLVAQRVNPDTRLTDAFVSIPPDAGFVLDQYVQGKFAAESKDALVVPRDAALPAEDGFEVFTVDDGKAVLHKVEVGLETDQEVEVSGGDLKEGQQVVVVGNYELENGMAVAAEPAESVATTTTTTTTEPAAGATTEASAEATTQPASGTEKTQ